ncbi:hypothetical protein SAY87_029471 [Trapa incisa]|uniref:Uncharacterized protein n=1 Tax=Trapa incisa TaxID=236973 RepID=A0AAN7KCY0_9MYRT|nr:hypothetical protein SAY87_029471 [Trapa incisa]
MGDFTVQMSNELVDRLLGSGEKKKKPRKIKPKVSKEPQRPSSVVNAKTKSAEPGVLKPPLAVWPLQPPQFHPAPPPAVSSLAEIEAIRSLLRESESVVEKLQKQEENIVQEVTQRAKDLRDKEFKLPNQKPMPCLAESSACLECYKEHSKDPLKCSHLVKSFADCARRARQQASPTD